MTSASSAPVPPPSPAPATATASTTVPIGYRIVEERPSIFAELFGSKKFVAMLVGIGIALLSSFGIAVDEEQRQEILNLVMAYLGAQGIADAGKSFAQVRAKPNPTTARP